MADLVARLPPAALEAERAVLGACLVDPGAVDVVSPLLRSQDFHALASRTLWDLFVDLRERGKPLDVVVLAEELESRGQLEAVGGLGFLAELGGCVPSSANAEHYAGEVLRAAFRRSLTVVGERIKGLGYAATAADKTPDLALEAESLLLEVTQARQQTDAVRVGKVIPRVIELMEGRTKVGLATGYWALDDLYAPGLGPGTLNILAARPSMGKTSLALGIAANVCRAGGRVFLASLEMSKEQLTVNATAAESRTSNTAIASGEVSRDHRAPVFDALEEIDSWALEIDDRPSQRAEDIRGAARRMSTRAPIHLVIVDYVQLLAGDPRLPRVEQIGSAGRVLKALARELGIPVLALAQLNRMVEGRPSKEPLMSDLKGSGDLEQDADTVSLLWRPEYYDRDHEPKGESRVVVAKNRNGPTGEVRLHFQRAWTRFEDWGGRGG